MLTPPYHFSTIASPPHPYPPTQGENRPIGPQILYRGSIPAQRNLSFLRRLNLRTLIYLKKKELKDDADDLVRWAKRRGVRLKWVKAESMGEEKLGMGKNEVGDVLKTILDSSSYPLYIADIDGISHTTLIVACLRKLQGWHMDSIINEICRFEPDHEDLPLVPFIQSYLSPQSSSSSSSSFASSGATTNPSGLSSFTSTNANSGFNSSSNTSLEQGLVLPAAPYPTWLWPTPKPTPTSSQIQSTGLLPNQAQGQNAGSSSSFGQKENSGAASSTVSGIGRATAGASSTFSQTQGQASGPTQGRARDKPTPSSSSTSTSSSRNPVSYLASTSTTAGAGAASVSASSSTTDGHGSPVLPFPHPLDARRHPTMRLAFPMLPPPLPSSTVINTNTNTLGGSSTNPGQLPTSPLSSSPLLSPSIGSVVERTGGSNYHAGGITSGSGAGQGQGQGQGSLSRVSSRREKGSSMPPPASPVIGSTFTSTRQPAETKTAAIPASGTNDSPSLGHSVSGVISAGLAGMANVLVGSEDRKAPGVDPAREASHVQVKSRGKDTDEELSSDHNEGRDTTHDTAAAAAVASLTGNKLGRQVSFHSASERERERERERANQRSVLQSPPLHHQQSQSDRASGMPNPDPNPNTSTSTHTNISEDSATVAAGSSSTSSSSPVKKSHTITREPTISSYSSTSDQLSSGAISPRSTQGYLQDDRVEGGEIPEKSRAGLRTSSPEGVDAGSPLPSGIAGIHNGEAKAESEITGGTEEDEDGNDYDEEGEDDDEDDDEEDDDEDDDDDGDQPTSQYISALDLAGFG
ncbi:hypothetical protein IAT40_006285 [Kwoniella sp. CBS 6097]